jgi:HAD superfamily hydrolase (TIGR01509 family)
MEDLLRCMESIRALLFDFDGLILETEGAVFTAWQEAYASLGLVLPYDLWVTTIGTMHAPWDPRDDLKEKLGANGSLDAVLAQVKKREMEIILSQPVLPGVEDYLKSARRLGLKTAVASSSSHSWVAGHLSRLGLLDYFDCLRTKDDVTLTKPSPELYLAAMSALGVTAGECLVFEDSPNGVLAAHRAGARCVAVPTAITESLPLDLADLRVSSLAEMPLEALLEKLAHHPTG